MKSFGPEELFFGRFLTIKNFYNRLFALFSFTLRAFSGYLVIHDNVFLFKSSVQFSSVQSLSCV